MNEPTAIPVPGDHPEGVALRPEPRVALDWKIIPAAAWQAVLMLNPRGMMRNPVMFVTWLGAALTALLSIDALVRANAQAWYFLVLAAWLWLTVWLANLAEALAEARGRAQAAALRRSRTGLKARRIAAQDDVDGQMIAATELECGELVRVVAGEMIPVDGTVVLGVASVDESAMTGESAPVIRESGGDRSAVTGGTKVLSDWLVIEVTARPGSGFLDRMIAMIEGASRSKTPNETALTLVLAGFTLVFLLVCVTLVPIARFIGVELDVPTLVALLVCLIPTTIGGLLPAVGIAGMARLSRVNVLASSGRAVEAAGDVDVLLLDKTGTITLGNRQASQFLAAPGVSGSELVEAAQLASLADETPEGRSIVVLAKELHNIRTGHLPETTMEFVPFSARTRWSGVNVAGRQIRKGAVDAIGRLVESAGGQLPSAVKDQAEEAGRRGMTPLAVADGARVLGLVLLKDILKGGMRERFAELRRIGIRTVMITGDNPRTAAAIAAEAGVDDFLAEATPEAKLELIRSYQKQGHMVAMTGDGTNDAPALAQADVAVAMNTGTQAAKEAGNMIDLDSNPTKLLDIVAVGKQMLMTRGALTTFSIANDIAKYFAIIPAMFLVALPQLAALNVMSLATPRSAILSAVIFNALVIPALVPLALRGVRWRGQNADRTLAANLLVFGLGGLLVPFAGIKLIDLSLVWLPGMH